METNPHPLSHHSPQRRRLNRRLRMLAPCLLVAGLTVTGLIGWQYRSNSASSYRYPFIKLSTQDALQQVQAELAFLQARAAERPNDGLVRADLAQSYFKMGKATGETHWYLQAEQTARRSLSLLPFDNEGATLVLARVAEAKHDFKTAIQLANEILSQKPNHPDALGLLVTSSLAQGNLEDAAEKAAQLVKQIPTLPSLMLQALVNVGICLTNWAAFSAASSRLPWAKELVTSNPSASG